MYIVALSGSPSRPSRTARLLDKAISLLDEQGVTTDVISIYDFAAEDLLYGRFNSDSIKHFQEKVKGAAGIIVATPVYKSAYSGALKTLLDVLPEGSLAGKPVLPLVSGGTSAHMLVVDYAIKPVLSALKAKDIHSGVFAVEHQLTTFPDGKTVLVAELEQRLISAITTFTANLRATRPATIPGPYELRDSIAASRISV